MSLKKKHVAFILAIIISSLIIYVIYDFSKVEPTYDWGSPSDSAMLPLSIEIENNSVPFRIENLTIEVHKITSDSISKEVLHTRWCTYRNVPSRCEAWGFWYETGTVIFIDIPDYDMSKHLTIPKPVYSPEYPQYGCQSAWFLTVDVHKRTIDWLLN